MSDDTTPTPKPRRKSARSAAQRPDAGTPAPATDAEPAAAIVDDDAPAQPAATVGEAPHLPNDQRTADGPHVAGIPTDPASIARSRAEVGLSPLPPTLRLRANATDAERRAHEQAVAREVDQIAMMFSRGNNEYEIRAQLGLSRRTFEHRVRRLKRASLDSHIVWTKFMSSASQDLKRLYYIYSKAIREQKPRYSVALDAIRAMHDIRCSIIEQGQSLGVYERKVEDFGLSWPEITMGLLLSDGRAAGVLPVGNIHRDPPANLLTLPQMEDAVDGELVDEGDAGDVPTDDEVMQSGAGAA